MRSFWTVRNLKAVPHSSSTRWTLRVEAARLPVHTYGPRGLRAPRVAGPAKHKLTTVVARLVGYLPGRGFTHRLKSPARRRHTLCVAVFGVQPLNPLCRKSIWIYGR